MIFERHSHAFANLFSALACAGIVAIAAIAPASAQSSPVVINEVHYDQASGEQEFIELFVVSGPVNLTGWTISDQDELTYALGGSGKPCNGSLTLSTGDRLVIWQGNGTNVCTGSSRKIFLNGPTILQRDGDDVVLRNNSNQCRDYVAFESGSSVNPKPSGCNWSGTNRNNGNVVGVSLSRFDAPIFADTDNASDWERSGATTTTGPKTPGAQNEVLPDADSDGVPDGSDNCPVVSNPGQANADGDGVGDACDNCPGVTNANQANADGDGMGDACDDCPNDAANDGDVDGVCGNVDNCPSTANSDQADSNGNGVGDACESSSPFSVFLNEVHYDQASGEQEFIELYVVSGPVDLTGWTLSDQDQVTYALGAPGQPCAGALTLTSGERMVVWQGAGTSDCTGPDREIFLNRGTFLQQAGDDLVLRSADGVCRDYVAFETGSSVNPRPADCPWSGPNPSNGNALGVSISRFDAPPFTDTNTGGDWERSGATTTIGPETSGDANESVDVDADGDGFTVAGGDCNDDNASINPDAAEVCDGVDNDCDGSSDDGFADGDGDGVGDACDNCPAVANVSQVDSDANGVGDACQPGAVVISEVHYDQASGQQEFVELLVIGVAANLTGWTLTDQDEMTYVLGLTGQPCFGSLSLNPGDRLVIWQGAGTSVCTGPSRQIYLNRATFLQRNGDDLVLRGADATCRDYVAFENGPSVNPAPGGCSWTGPNPNNGAVEQTSVSRFDAPPFSDTDSGADWERSGATTTIGPRTPGGVNEIGCSVDSDCDDGNACTTDSCVSAGCVNAVIDCNDNDACTDDACDLGFGCYHLEISCDDGLYCTTDSCDSGSGCQHASVSCDDSNACTTDSCNEGTDTCDHVNTCFTFCSASSIVLNDRAAGALASPATPYPSVITVAGLSGTAILTRVQLNGLTHTFPDDLDMLLVSPSDPAVNAKIMSDVGLGADVSNINLTLTDSAAASLPDGGPLVSGTFKPTDVDPSGDPFPAPAPVATNATALSTFGGTNLNGDWKLYIIDDATVDTGTLTQWCLEFEAGCSQDADCDDSNACTTDSCNAGTGVCTNAPITCDDSNACTTDTCDPSGGCVYTSDGDVDNDGHEAQGACFNGDDCDDLDPNNYPGNSEVCDGFDNNCDTQVDEDLTADLDGDGYTSLGSCEGSADDCDDNNGDVYPTNPEVCDSVDNDCDGSIDEANSDFAAFGVTEALTRPTTCGVGECADNTGFETCIGGAYGNDTCDPYEGATAEVCDGLDNDCDDQVDEELTYDNDNDGYSSLDSCEGSRDDCDDFNPDTYPGASEICDSLDNDCDGTADNGLTYDDDGDGHTSIGSCEGSADDCDDFDSNNYPGNSEVCDGFDNNCDTVVDEGLTFDEDGDGHTAVGSCEGFADDCDDYNGDVFPGNFEVCDNVDNDCDASVDEPNSRFASFGQPSYLTQPTTCGVGACSGNTGYETCIGGEYGNDTCDPYEGATEEVCDSEDNDCDGDVDEDGVCN